MPEEGSFAWFAGVDWSSEKHQVCIVDPQGNVAGEREFPHSGAGLAELSDWLLSIAGAVSTVAIGIEVPHAARDALNAGEPANTPVAEASRPRA